MQAVSSDAAARGIQERTAQLLSQWGCLRGRCQEQERWLRELLALAERFWHGLSELAVALSDTQQLVLGLEEAGGEPEAIRTRLRTMQALREEIDALQGELDTLGSLGVELMASCGDPDKPDVTKSLDDLYSSWHSLSRVWTERNGRLEEQLQAALSYQDTMQRLLEWLDAAELRISEEFLVGGDLDMVQQQLAELKEFKRELYQCKVDVESLRHQGGTGQGDAPATLSDFRQRWDHLEEEIVSRQVGRGRGRKGRAVPAPGGPCKGCLSRPSPATNRQILCLGPAPHPAEIKSPDTSLGAPTGAILARCGTLSPQCCGGSDALGSRGVSG
ncbi:PREDICTED: microtubule-actin cross-linking factor 1-like [Corvus brachyrhynchos]|uniref:microtubule-actin cross-linking factor 1-like n=1 Tax=Corvus brachyrhynchos TaxID=85066 RepID=UPI0008167D0F|nr:PREDICTED: microtubule-actin cross-linking factor 1-like [Corvus brachyrhynchos]